ncbi:hypothetical protein T492DRAFT_839687 [Pavlovales sp. CCMP2436]|nr:hypothetical protein T492DRAFT_839687 [Pavlovales sp. CCMP2436]
MASAAPGERAFAALYTKHKTQKRKVWQDGVLCAGARGQLRLFNDAGSCIATSFAKEETAEGTEYDFEAYLVTVDGELEEGGDGSTDLAAAAPVPVVQRPPPARRAGLAAPPKSAPFVAPPPFVPPPELKDLPPAQPTYQPPTISRRERGVQFGWGAARELPPAPPPASPLQPRATQPPMAGGPQLKRVRRSTEEAFGLLLGAASHPLESVLEDPSPMERRAPTAAPQPDTWCAPPAAQGADPWGASAGDWLSAEATRPQLQQQSYADPWSAALAGFAPVSLSLIGCGWGTGTPAGGAAHALAAAATSRGQCVEWESGMEDSGREFGRGQPGPPSLGLGAQPPLSAHGCQPSVPNTPRLTVLFPPSSCRATSTVSTEPTSGDGGTGGGVVGGGGRAVGGGAVKAAAWVAGGGHVPRPCGNQVQVGDILSAHGLGNLAGSSEGGGVQGNGVRPRVPQLYPPGGGVQGNGIRPIQTPSCRPLQAQLCVHSMDEDEDERASWGMPLQNSMRRSFGSSNSFGPNMLCQHN